MKINHKLSYITAGLIYLLLISFDAKTALGQDKVQEPEPRNILSAAVQAIKELKYISYDANFEAANPGQKTMTVKGHVKIGRGGVSNQILPGKIYVKSEGFGGAQEILFDGKVARRIEHEKKLLIEGIAEKGGVSVAMSAPLTLLQRNFIWAEPMKFESAATSAEYLGQASVGGVLCHVVDLHYSVPGTDISEGRWWFAVEDKLPRMFQTIDKMAAGAVVRELRITNFLIENQTSEAGFKLELPKGYSYQSYVPSNSKAKLIAVGDTAPDWVLANKSGQERRLSDYRGKVVLLKFWASWCGYCKLAIPEIQHLYEKFKEKGVEILGINFQELDGVDAEAYLKTKNAYYPTFTNGEKIAGSYGVGSVPVFFVIDQEGKVVFAESGFNPNIRVQLEEAINLASTAKIK